MFDLEKLEQQKHLRWGLLMKIHVAIAVMTVFAFISGINSEINSPMLQEFEEAARSAQEAAEASRCGLDPGSPSCY